MLILSLYPPESLSNYLSQIEDLLTCLLQDAKAEARQLARFAYYKYKKMMPEKAQYIFTGLDMQN